MKQLSTWDKYVRITSRPFQDYFMFKVLVTCRNTPPPQPTQKKQTTHHTLLSMFLRYSADYVVYMYHLIIYNLSKP